MMNHQPDAEKRVLSARIIARNLRNGLPMRILSCACALLFLAFVGAVFGVAAYHLAEAFSRYDFGISVIWAILPLGAAFVYFCFPVGYEVFITVRELRDAYGTHRKIVTDTLYKVSEGESESYPRFSMQRMVGRRRRYTYPVTAYYFEENGRFACSVGAENYHYEGDRFFLVINVKTNRIVAMYNQRYYTLQAEDDSFGEGSYEV